MKTALIYYGALLCVFLTLNTVCSCIYIPQNTLPKVGDLPPLANGAEKPALTYAFSSAFKNETGETEDDEQTAVKYEYDEFMDVFGRTGYFSSISPSGDWDIDIEIRYTLYQDPLLVQIGLLSILTLTALPGYVPESYHITAIVTAQNAEKHTYEINENGFTTVTWLPLLLFSWGFPPDTTRIDIRKNMYRTLLFKMQQDGILPIQAKTLAK